MPEQTPRDADSPDAGRPGWRGYARVAVRPRMLGLLVALLIAVLVCGRLGAWQLDRAQERGAASERAAAQALAAASPREISLVLPEGSAMVASMVGEAVTALGRFDADGQLVVPGRVVGGVAGFYVLTPFMVDDGRVLAVVRGWVDSPDQAEVPPSGTVEISGWLQGSEGASGVAASPGMVEAISTAQLVNLWGGPIYPAYLVQDQGDKGAAASGSGGVGVGAVVPVPRPVATAVGGWQLQNVLYAVQWWVFGAFAGLLYWRQLKDAASTRP